MKKILFTCSALIFAFVGFTQSPSEEYTELTTQFPGKSAVYTKNNETVTMVIKGEDIVITSHFDEVLFLTDDNASQYSKKNIYYSGFYSLGKIEAFSEVPNGKKYKKNIVTNFTESEKLGSSFIFHDDIKTKNFFYSSLEKGSKTNLQYSKTYNDPHFFGSFQFQSRVPIKESVFKIHVPNDVELGYILLGNIDSLPIEFSKEQLKDETVYTWSAKNVDGLKSEDGAPSSHHIAPHIQVYIKKYKTESGKEKVLYNDVSNLHSWYAYLLQHTPQEIGPEFKAVCDSINKISTSEEEKVKNVFYWVQDNINYIAFEAGLEGFVPRGANSIFEKRYGDCKDMGNIIVTMLKQMGVTAHHTWVGSRDIPYSYDQVPTTACDNHMIATYIDKNNNPIFLDATSKMLPYGRPSSFIQGKQTLVNSVGDKPYALYYVPIIPSDQNLYLDTTYIKIEDKTVTGTTHVTLEGYQKQRLNQSFVNSTEKQIKEKIESFVEKGSNAYILNSQTVTNIGERDKPLEIQADFSIKNYVTVLNDEMYINLNLDFLTEDFELEKDRKYPQEYTRTAKYVITNILEIPSGYKLDYIPEDQEYTSNVASYKITYKVKNNTLIYTVSLQSDVLMLEREDFETMRIFIKSIKNAYNESIILKKK